MTCESSGTGCLAGSAGSAKGVSVNLQEVDRE